MLWTETICYGFFQMQATAQALIESLTAKGILSSKDITDIEARSNALVEERAPPDD